MKETSRERETTRVRRVKRAQSRVSWGPTEERVSKKMVVKGAQGYRAKSNKHRAGGPLVVWGGVTLTFRGTV